MQTSETLCLHHRVVRNTIFRKAPPSVVSGYGKRPLNLNKFVATFEKHIFLSQTDLTRTVIISNSYVCQSFFCMKRSLYQEMQKTIKGVRVMVLNATSSIFQLYRGGLIFGEN
jgi:hypothetical protein